MNTEKARQLQKLAQSFRMQTLEVLHEIQTGHPGGSLSAAEILTVLYFDKMHIDPARPDMPDRDRLILSKGHAAPMLYTVLANRGYFPAEELHSLRQAGSCLQGHPCLGKTPGVDLSSGPLGLGLGAGLGMALAARMDHTGVTVYVVLGDGELQEGAVWESAMAAAKYRPGNLIAVVDNNGVQLDGTNDEIMPLGDLTAKFSAFGWRVIPCDGHDAASLSDALDAAGSTGGAPALVLAKTVKGKGVRFMEGKSMWHGRPIGDTEYAAAMAELGGTGV